MTLNTMAPDEQELGTVMRSRAHKVIELARAIMGKANAGAPDRGVLRKASKPWMALATNTCQTRNF